MDGEGICADHHIHQARLSASFSKLCSRNTVKSSMTCCHTSPAHPMQARRQAGPLLIPGFQHSDLAVWVQPAAAGSVIWHYPPDDVPSPWQNNKDFKRDVKAADLFVWPGCPRLPAWAAAEPRPFSWTPDEWPVCQPEAIARLLHTHRGLDVVTFGYSPKEQRPVYGLAKPPPRFVLGPDGTVRRHTRVWVSPVNLGRLATSDMSGQATAGKDDFEGAPGRGSSLIPKRFPSSFRHYGL